jgi:hypothetical protein
MESLSPYSSTIIEIQLEFKRQSLWGSGTDEVIDSTIFSFQRIEHHETIVGYVSMHIGLPISHSLFVLASIGKSANRL